MTRDENLTSSEWTVSSAGAGWGVPPFGKQQGDTAIIRAADGRKTFYRAPWLEIEGDRPDHGPSAILLTDLGASATDALVPIRDFPFWRDPARWLFWREDATVHAFGTASQRQSLALADVPTALLRPAVQREGKDVTLFALSQDRRHVHCLVFPREKPRDPADLEDYEPGEAPPPSPPGTEPRIAGTIELPVEASAGAVALAPDRELVALVGRNGEDVTLILAASSGAKPRTASIPRAALVPNAAPAISATADGGAIVGVLVSTSEGIAVAEVVFSADAATTERVSLRRLGRFDEAPVAGALLYHSTPAEAAHLVRVVVRLSNGLFLRSESGMLEPAAFEAPPVVPIVLAPRSHGAFILVCDPRIGPIMAEA